VIRLITLLLTLLAKRALHLNQKRTKSKQLLENPNKVGKHKFYYYSLSETLYVGVVLYAADRVWMHELPVYGVVLGNPHSPGS
jgi:hypothetical protein